MNFNKNKILFFLFSTMSINSFSQNASKIFYSYLLELNNPSFAGLTEISHLSLISNQTYDLNKRSYGYENFVGTNFTYISELSEPTFMSRFVSDRIELNLCSSFERPVSMERSIRSISFSTRRNGQAASCPFCR